MYYNYPYFQNQAPQYNNQAMQQQPQQIQPQQQIQQQFIQMYFVGGEDEAKRYIVMPNQIVYLKDINSNIIYEKKANNIGEYALKKYELKDLSAPTENTPVYALKSDLEALSSKVDKLLNGGGSNVE